MITLDGSLKGSPKGSLIRRPTERIANELKAVVQRYSSVLISLVSATFGHDYLG